MRHRVPGTFKTAPPDRLVRDLTAGALSAVMNLQRAGALYSNAYRLADCNVLVALEPTRPGGPYRWHLSISHPERYPTWDEIKSARYLAHELADVRVMAQLLPLVVSGEWVNLHENCFHLHEIIDPET